MHFCILSSLLACTKKAPICKEPVIIEKLQGIKSMVLEKTHDKTKIKLGEEEYFLFINKESQLVLQQEKMQKVLFDLKTPEGQSAYFAELEWAGDSNKDCKVDLVIWKKQGAFLGTSKSPTESHNQTSDEKFFIESQKDIDLYKIQSLGHY